jgi:ABC-type multidrug transport system ATPase subunit
VDKAARDAFVQHVMNILELNEIADAVVGIRGESGLSFEQRKRLTIGVELVANPAILVRPPDSMQDRRSS